MNQVKAKVYYEIATGNVLIVTSESQGSVIETTKEHDMGIYPELKYKNIDEVDFIELEYGALTSTFANLKSYSVNIKTKQLELNHYTLEELEYMKIKYQEDEILNNRINDISNYLLEQQGESLRNFEDLVIQAELNKIMEGMN